MNTRAENAPVTGAGVVIDWASGQFILGVAGMDETHRQFADLVNRLSVADTETFIVLFGELCVHSELHFQDEESRMQLCGFPAIREHRDEHHRVLAEMVQMRRQVERGVIGLARAYVRDGLPAWFRLHAITMDSALAAHWKHYEDLLSR